ncbi:MAG: hypothetical protein ACWA5L_06770 [bacterium]
MRPTQEKPEMDEKNISSKTSILDNEQAMLGLVIGLGVVLLATAAGFFYMLLNDSPKPATHEPAIPELTLALRPDEKITNMELNGSTLALHLEGPDGQRILLVNPYTMDHKAVINIVE